MKKEKKDNLNRGKKWQIMSLTRNLYSEHIKNSYNSIIKRLITQLKNSQVTLCGKKKKKKKKGRRYLTDISPRKIDKWSLSTRREA